MGATSNNMYLAINCKFLQPALGEVCIGISIIHRIFQTLSNHIIHFHGPSQLRTTAPWMNRR